MARGGRTARAAAESDTAGRFARGRALETTSAVRLGEDVAVDRVVRFVRARRPDRPLIDADSLRDVVVLNGGALVEETTTSNKGTDAEDEMPRGMSTRGMDRGDDLYATRDVRMSWFGARRAGAGLANLGNTCFLNSVLQCLTHTPALAHFALSGEHKKYKTSGSFNAMYEIGEHVARALNSSGRTIAPTAVVKNMRALSKTFRKGRQEDAHELARCLLDAMHKKCVELVKPKISPNSARGETSFVWKVFGGKLRSRVNCKTCGRNSETFDPFLDLSLEVGRAKSVLGAFKLFTHTEILDGDNKYKCEGKNPGQSKPHFTKASKQFTVDQAPNVLAVQLKRFAYVPFGRGKLSHFVEYPLVLDVTPYLSDEDRNSKNRAVYDLYGVLVHAGSSSNSGHYYCFVKTATGTWCEMDDESVSSVSEKTVLKQQAYLLFYARRNAPGTFEQMKKLCQNVPDAARALNSLETKSAAAELKTQPAEKRKQETVENVRAKKETVSKENVSTPSLGKRKLGDLNGRASPVRSSVSKSIVRSKSPSVRSAFDSAKRALLLRRLRRLSHDVGVTLEDIPAVIASDAPVRTRNAMKEDDGEGLRDWLAKTSTSAKWDEEDGDAQQTKKKKKTPPHEPQTKMSASGTRARRAYDQFDEEYDRGKTPKHRRRKEKAASAPPLPKPGAHRARQRNPFQKRGAV